MRIGSVSHRAGVDCSLSNPPSIAGIFFVYKNQKRRTTMPLENINIASFTPLPTPGEIKALLPTSEAARVTVEKARAGVRNIIRKTDSRLVVIAGPCSVHDAHQTLEYAEKLAALARKYEDKLLILMRVYVDKPRTTVGWRGFMNDPEMNFTNDFLEGLKQTRDLMIKVNELGLGVATEMLDPFAPQFMSDLVAWGAIGARTTESQTHRTMASGLSMAIGFKNSTEGNAQVAVDAIVASSSPQVFLGINSDGLASVVQTNGNPDGHVILRGGRSGKDYVTNFAASNVLDASDKMRGAKLNAAVMIDCSHANSSYDHTKQSLAWTDALEQKFVQGSQDLVGMMIESNLRPGKQSIPADHDKSKLEYGVSVTDACVGWEETTVMLEQAHNVAGKQLIQK
jgi:3-deoxy-7-phosphoheptulonate synthase